MSVAIYEHGLPMVCSTEGCTAPATSVWSSGVIAGGHSAGTRYACGEHNPMSFPGALPVNFHSQTLCHACGQPVGVSSLIANPAAVP